jgi:hypothetical protein
MSSPSQPDNQGGCGLHHEAFTYGCPGCLDYADDLLIARQVRDRDAAGPGVRIPLEQLEAEDA